MGWARTPFNWKKRPSTVYKLTVKDVPVEGFWSISLYNAEGFFAPNKFNAYTLNNITGKKSGDGSVAIQFGGCDGQIANCLSCGSIVHAPKSSTARGSSRRRRL